MASPVMPIDYVSSKRIVANLFNGVCKPVAWIAGCLVAVDAEVQVRSVGTTGLTDTTDQLSGFYLLSLGDMKFL